MFSVFAAFFLVVWWRDRDAGLDAIGLSALLVAAFYVARNVGLVPPPAALLGPWWLTMLLACANLLLGIGLARYVAGQDGWRSRLLWLASAPQLGLVLAALASVPVPRPVGNAILGSAMPVLAWLMWRAARREPGVGHRWVAASLLVLPALMLAMSLRGIDTVYLQYVSVPALITLHLTLSVVCMRRRRKALEDEVARRREAEQALVEVHDALERRVQERSGQLREVIVGLETFNRCVSKDLRAPLGGISGLAQDAVEAIDDGRDRQAIAALTAVSTQAGRLNDLLNALLELAQIAATPVHRVDCPLRSAVDAAMARLRAAAPSLRSPVAASELPEVWADPEMLKSVLVHLLGNAYKFSEGAQAPVEVGARVLDTEVCVFVRDHGVGLPPGAADALFSPLVRLHPDFPGHGVGLATVKRIVERHGGRVWAEGQPGHGATFFFTLARAPAAAAADPPAQLV